MSRWTRLLCVAALALAATACAPPLEITQPPPAPVAQPKAAPPPAAPVASATSPCSFLSIAAVGDIMLGTDYPQDALPPDDAREVLADVAPELRTADITFGNLEGVLMDGGEPVKTCKDASVCFLFRSPTRYAQTLRSAGFDVMSLANNHARDFGEIGRSSSMATLDAAGILHSGRLGDVASWEQNGKRIALIGFSFTSGSHSINDIEGARALVTDLATRHDLVIVSFHGGAEGGDATRVPFTMEHFVGEDRGNVVEFARAMVDAGADLVLGHGPHVVRAIETYKERLIVYSLGNFATWTGISVTGVKGYAPILKVVVDDQGRFAAGRIVSAIQLRPDGVKADPEQRAFRLIRDMTALDLSGGGVQFDENGGFRPLRSPDARCAAEVKLP